MTVSKRILKKKKNRTTERIKGKGTRRERRNDEQRWFVFQRYFQTEQMAHMTPHNFSTAHFAHCASFHAKTKMFPVCISEEWKNEDAYTRRLLGGMQRGLKGISLVAESITQNGN